MSLDADTITTIHATVPALEAYGTEIIDVFYTIVFTEYPQLKGVFNMSHQRPTSDHPNGAQRQALKQAVIAYAKNIHQLEALLPSVYIITQKHVSVGVLPEHYPIVGKTLLRAIKQVLQDAATPDIMTAWTKAYGVLADLLIAQETTIRKELKKVNDGYAEWTNFRIVKKEQESLKITSFYLQPTDTNVSIPHFEPGQYLSIQATVPGQEHTCVRNYSISCAPGGDSFRITVKRETSTDETIPSGIVSTYLHTDIDVDSIVVVGPPCGHFTLKTNDEAKPVVFLSGGIGITPLMSMMEHELSREGVTRAVHSIQCWDTSNCRIMGPRVQELCKMHSRFSSTVFYSKEEEPIKHGMENVHTGRFTTDGVLPEMSTNCEIYLCGPLGFMQSAMKQCLAMGIPSSNIYYESFGPEVSF